jgi:type IV secretory pathway TraG/TraD family ATPase VirD4
VIVLDIPVKEYLDLGQAAQVLFKLMWQRAAERRDPAKYPRPVCLFADEAQLFLTSHDTLFQATARSARVASVLLTQNIDSIRERFPAASAKSAADALLGNFHTKVFCSNGHVGTNEWAAKLIGEEWQTRSNVSASLGGEGAMSAGTVESRRFLVDPIEFARLAKGGPENGGMVEAIVYRSGQPFAETLTNHLTVAFPQDSA